MLAAGASKIEAETVMYVAHREA